MKYKTIEDIKKTNEYARLYLEFVTNPSKQTCFDWLEYIREQGRYCEEYQNKIAACADEYMSHFVNVKDVGLGDEGMFV